MRANRENSTRLAATSEHDGFINSQAVLSRIPDMLVNEARLTACGDHARQFTFCSVNWDLRPFNSRHTLYIHQAMVQEREMSVSRARCGSL